MVSPGTCLSEKHHEQVPEPSSGPDVAETARLCPPVWRNFFNLITHCCAELCNTSLQSWSKLFRIGIRVDTQSSSGPWLHLQPRTWLKCLLNVSPSPLSRTLYSTNVFDLISIQSENKQTPRFSSHPSIPCLLRSVPSPHNTLLELYRNVIKRENWIKKKIRFLFYLEISKVFRSSF